MSATDGIKVYGNPDIKTKYYAAFSGVDLTTDFTNITENHSPYMLNMIRDYKNGGILRTRPRLKYNNNVGKETASKPEYIVFGEELLLKTGKHLYRINTSDNTTEEILYLGKPAFGNALSVSTVYKTHCHIIDGNKLYFYDKSDDGHGDVYIYDGVEINRFSNALDMFKLGITSNIYYETGFIFPLKYGTTTSEHYTASDYSQADFDRAFSIVSKKSTTAATDEEKAKYIFPTSPAHTTIMLSDCQTISQIITGKKHKSSFNKDDFILASANINKSFGDTGCTITDWYNFQRLDVDGNGTITQSDIDIIVASAAAASLDILNTNIELAPITYINGTGNTAGGKTSNYYAGEAYERINMLSPYFINTYKIKADTDTASTGVNFYFSDENATAVAYQYMTDKNATQITTTSVGSTNIQVTLQHCMREDTLYILCKMPDVDYYKNKDIVNEMQITQEFDNRVFMGGADGDLSSTIIHSGISNPLYFPDNAYYEDTEGSGVITALLPVKTQLAVIKKDTSGSNAIYIHTPTATSNDLAPKIYPSTYGFYDVGCVNKNCYCSFAGTSVFLSRKGLMAFTSTDMSDEKSIICTSSAVFNADSVSDNAYMWCDEEHLYIQNSYFEDTDCVNMDTDTQIYVADAKSTYINKNSGNREYDWFLWDGLIFISTTSNYNRFSAISAAITKNGCQYLLYSSRQFSGLISSPIYAIANLTFDNASDTLEYKDDIFSYITSSSATIRRFDILSVVSTPLYSFLYPQYYKSTFRKGNVALIDTTGTGNPYAEVFIKTSEDKFDRYYKYFVDGEGFVWRQGEGYTACQSFVDGKHLIFRPHIKNFLNMAVMFVSPSGSFVFNGATISAYVKKTINDIL